MLGLPGLIGQLFEDSLALARAEVRLAKSRAYDIVRRSRTAILLLGCAFMLAQGAIVALMLGFVLALAPIVGPAWAGVILLVAALALAGLLGWIALHHLAGAREKPSVAEGRP